MHLVPSEKKQEILEKLLDDGMVLVALDGRRPGVDLPARLQGDAQVRLNLSYRFGLSMDVGEWGLHATLTFGGVPYDCKVPWSALYLAYSHVSNEQYLFPSDVPEDLLEAAGGEARPEEAPVPVQGRPRFSVVDGGGSSEAPPSREQEESGQERGRGTHLRRIK